MGARIPKLKISEAEFTRQVLELARLRGWMTLHLRPARTAKGWRTPIQGDGKGFPDLFAIHPIRRLAFAAELKVGRNTTTPEQGMWLRSLWRARIPAYLWTPQSWAEIEAVLEGRT